MGAGVNFAAVGIAVADMDAAVAFYERLGLEKTQGDEHHTELALPGGTWLMLDSHATIQAFDPSHDPAAGGGRTSLAFACDSPAEVDGAYADLVGAGYEGKHEPWDAFWGQRYATVLDPDGNAVDLFAPLEG